MTKEINKEIPNRLGLTISMIATLNVALGIILTIWSILLIFVWTSGPNDGVIISTVACIATLITALRKAEWHKMSAIMIVILLGVTTYNVGLHVGAGLWALMLVVALWLHEKTYTNN